MRIGTTLLLAGALLVVALGTPAAGATQAPPDHADDELKPTSTPVATPSSSCAGGCTVAPAGCAIKGMISATGLKMYLLPRQPGYASAKINTAHGERWFCTIAEARAAGWKPSPQRLPARPNA